MTRPALLLFLRLAGLFLIGLAAPALAENGRNAGGNGQDHDRARDAVSREGARPLAAILPAIEARQGTRMVEVEVGSEDGRLVYEIGLITPSGRIIEVAVDVATGDIVGASAIVIAVAAVAFGLSALFAAHVERRALAELSVQLDQVMAGVARDADGALTLATAPADPRFERPLCGLYWQIEAEGGLLRSRSLWD